MPRWDHEVDLSDVFRNADLEFTARRDVIVERISEHAWFAGRDDFDLLVHAVRLLTKAKDFGDFNRAWELVYDEADADRVWIRTF